MRIQWSGDVAQEMLGKLQEANRGMQECLRRAAAARQQMAGADPDGQNRAMQAATERFERCSGRLQLLATQLGDFQRALRRAVIFSRRRRRKPFTSRSKSNRHPARLRARGSRSAGG